MNIINQHDLESKKDTFGSADSELQIPEAERGKEFIATNKISEIGPISQIASYLPAEKIILTVCVLCYLCKPLPFDE